MKKARDVRKRSTFRNHRRFGSPASIRMKYAARNNRAPDTVRIRTGGDR